MKKYIKSASIFGMANEQNPGVFWDIDGELLAFPYDPLQHSSGIAKSGDTYNHKKLWPDVKPKGCNKPYNYYPRGRVILDNQGRPVIYMNPNVSENLLKDIKVEFGLRQEPIIHYDNSEHYKSHLDDGWVADKSSRR